MRALSPLLLVAALACTETQRSGQTERAAQAPAATLGPDGYGPVKIGWSLAELNAALKQKLKPAYEINESCDYVTPAGLPPGMSLMVENDTIVRIDVDSAGVRTADGAGVGDDEASVLKRYAGRVTIMPHKYGGADDHYLVVSFTGDTLSQVIFETEGKKVTRFRAGRRPAVEYVEGCL